MGYAAGYTPQLDGLWADTKEEAWALYEQHKQTHSYPYPLCGRYYLPQPRRVLNEVAAREACKVGQTSAPPSPGGSDKAARLKPEDRVRISQREARAAEKRRKEREAEERRRAQGSMLDGMGGAS